MCALLVVVMAAVYHPLSGCESNLKWQNKPSLAVELGIELNWLSFVVIVQEK